jgi:hypothetical protein
MGAKMDSRVGGGKKPVYGCHAGLNQGLPHI